MMSSMPPKPEGRRRPVSVLALKLWEISEQLDQRLEAPAEVLDMLVTLLAKGEQATEVWSKLHTAAARFDRTGDLALAYEQITQDKRIKLLAVEQQAFIFLQAARFFSDVLGDLDGACGHLERAIAVVPGHPEAFQLLEELLTQAGRLGRLAEVYAEASQREVQPDRSLALLYRALTIAVSIDVPSDFVVELGMRILRQNPADDSVRDEVMRRLLVAGRHQDVVELLEQALRREPSPPPEEAKLHREQLVDLCLTVLRSPERALTHIEGLLISDPEHAMARQAAEALLGNPQLMLRAAASLSDAFEKTREQPRAISMLELELAHVRGPRRVEVQKRLAILRQDALGDRDGALELLGPVVAGDPGDDDLRHRFVSLNLALNQPEHAARLLSRALATHRDPAVRARVGVDVGHVYLASGDPRRAVAAFQKVIETNGEPRATLAAAKKLWEIHEAEGASEDLASALDVVVQLEPERELRQAAARKLALLADADGSVPNRARAVTAFRALVGSPWTEHALSRLEALYGEVNDDLGLSDVLAFRAERAEDAAQARELATRALELRTASLRDPAAAIEAFQSFANTFGPSREVHAGLAPLLEKAGRFEELVEVLLADIDLAPSEEQVRLWYRVAELRLTQLADTDGALEALTWAVALDPNDAPSRAALERLLQNPDTRLRAAAVLEPLYRRQQQRSGLFRVLDAKVGTEGDASARLVAAEEAIRIAEESPKDYDRALDIAGKGLVDALAAAPERILEWLAKLHQLATASGKLTQRAKLLAGALGDSAIDSPERFAIARALGDAYAAAGDLPAAVQTYRRALSFDPGCREIVLAIDGLLAQQGAPEERLALYESALAQESEPTRRRELLRAIAGLQRFERGDASAAAATLRRAIEEDGSDYAVHEALLDTLTSLGDHAGAAAELGRMLPHLSGDARTLALLRLAEAAERAADPAGALARYRELLSMTELSTDVLASIERLALEQNDGPTLVAVLERQLSTMGDARERAQLFERLGNAYSWQIGDSTAAAGHWLEGARLAASISGDEERARRLYDRVLDADPQHTEAAERVLELSARAGEHERAVEAFEALLVSASGATVVSALVGLAGSELGLRSPQTVVGLIHQAVEKVGEDSARPLKLLEASLLGRSPRAADSARALFHELLATAHGDATEEVQAFAAFLASAPPSAERSADLRFLYEYRAARTDDATALLREWARVEEHELGDPAAAIRLHERVLEREPNDVDAHLELTRLQTDVGDVTGAVATLEKLRGHPDAEVRLTAELGIAELMIERLDAAPEALERLRPLLDAAPSERDILRLIHRAHAIPAVREDAAALLDHAASAFEDPARRLEVVEALLAVTAESQELAELRGRWLAQLLDSRADDPEAALALALRGAESAPAERELWLHAEQLARRLEKPEAVAAAYERVFERDLRPALADELGRSMIEFFEEFFDDPERVVGLLGRVLELCPEATWAFDRLKLAFNAGGRWQELFAVYDAQLRVAPNAQSRIDLLREAAMAARDFAGDPERAMGYLEALHRENPDDARVEASLERLYERHSRKRPLIDLLTARLSSLGPSEQPDAKARIAALWMDTGEAGPALSLAEGLFDSPAHVADAVQLYERVIRLVSGESGDAPGIDEERRATLLRATGKLRAHYGATGSVPDVIRMLEIEERAAAGTPERRALLEQIVRLRLKELRDVAGAFETMADLVLLDPEHATYRKHLAELGKRIGAEDRRADVLVAAARSGTRVSVRTGLLNEAAAVYRQSLNDEGRAIELYREVLREKDVPGPVELTAARELAALLRASGEPAERVAVLERLAELEEDPALRRAALGEAAELAFERLADAPRAIRAYRTRITDDPQDIDAMNGLCRALEASEHWDELITALEARAAISEAKIARADRMRIAELHATVRDDAATATEAWRSVVALHGADRRTFEALSGLLTAQSRWEELSQLLTDEINTSTDFDRQRQLFLELGELHEHRTQDPMRALDAYVAAGDWTSAVRVASSPGMDGQTSGLVAARLFELSVAAWQALGAAEDSAPARAADWALGALYGKLVEEERYSEAVEQLLDGARLPFGQSRRRELVRDAAFLASDRLGEGDRAIELFQNLLDEDAGDDIAKSTVTRLSLLLEEKGRFDVIATLWENQAIARALANDVPAAQLLWARAGEIAEERLGDWERAIGAYERGAELGGEACLEALARVFGQRGDKEQVARALDRLCAISAPELLSERALRLADAYIALGRRGRARDALEDGVARVPDATELRKRLAALYREAEDFSALAELLEEEAARAAVPAEALALLKQAAELHLERRRAPAAAVPLLERAVVLEPDDSMLRLRLAQALYRADRYEESTSVLREQLARYGARRPKDRALVHYELARVLLASSDRAGALHELDAAARIDPAHPKILHMLARTALEQGELDRAERMFRALLLVAARDGDHDAPTKSEALVALGEIARGRGDAARAEEFLASAFEAAQESAREALALEQALRGRERPELLAQVLELRLSQGLPPQEAVQVLADLAEVRAANEAAVARSGEELSELARALEDELARREVVDDEPWSSLGRAYAALGVSSAEARILERRVAASVRSSGPPPGPDLYYRLAQMRIADSAQVDAGLDFLRRALDAGLDPSAAEALLRQVFVEGSEPPGVLDLFEAIARAHGDRTALLRVLERRAALGVASITSIREGVALAEELHQPELGDALLEAAIAVTASDAAPSDAAWLRLELAKRHRRAGDLGQALALEEQAAEYLDEPEQISRLLEIAREARQIGDLDGAARTYGRLVRRFPGDPAYSEPLLDVYRQAGKAEELAQLLAEVARVASTMEQRTQLRLERAELLLGPLGRRDEGTELLREIVRDDPKERAAHTRLFELLDAEGKEDELIDLFDSEIEAQRERGDREAASALTLRLISWLERHGRDEDAVRTCRAALEYDPERRELLETFARLAERAGDAVFLGDVLERQLVLAQGDEASALCHRLLALRQSTGDTPGEERALQLGFEACPGDREILERLASIHARQGDRARVTKLFERAVLAAPDDATLLRRLVEVYREAGQLDRALATLDALEAKEGGSGFARRTRATLLVELGQHDEAIDALQGAAEDDPALYPELVAMLERAHARVEGEERARISRLLIDALEKMGEPAAARAHLAQLVDAHPDDLSLLTRLAELEMRAGDHEAALATYSRLVEVLEGDLLVGATLAFADLCQRMGQPARARAALERSFLADRSNGAIRERLTAVLEADGAYRAVAELLREEADAEPRRDERAKKLVRVGELLLLPDGDVQEAIAVLETARGELKDSIEVIVLLARAYSYAGRQDTALGLLDSCIDAHRGKRLRALAAIYEQKADVVLEQGVSVDALGALAKAFEMDPKNARLGMRVSRVALELGEMDIAQRTLRAVAIMRTAPVDGPEGARADTKAEANFFLAELAQRAGDPRKARVLAAKALSENPDHEGARALLKTLDAR